MERDAHPERLTVSPESGQIGIYPRTVRRSRPIPALAASALTLPSATMRDLFKALFAILTKSPNGIEAAGPVGVMIAMAPRTPGTTALVIALELSAGWPLALGIDAILFVLLGFLTARAAPE